MKKVMYNDYINRLAILRERCNLSARELSLRLGKSPSYISLIESGKVNVTLKALLDILEVLNVDFEEFAHFNFESYNLDREILTLFKDASSTQKEGIKLMLG